MDCDASGSRQQKQLEKVAKETLRVLPGYLEKLNATTAAYTSHKFTLESLHRLNPNICPSYPQPAVIRVINGDTLNVAIELSQWAKYNGPDLRLINPHVALINCANRHSPGGGWLNGRMAQEEALCYRSSLALSLNPGHYPFSGHDALYSPYVLGMRDDVDSGHRLMAPNIPTNYLPVVSVLTVAALCYPKIHTFKQVADDKGLLRDVRVFVRDEDRTITKNKMRLVLRMAASHGHRLLVLGAFGCGVYENPPEDVAHCWLEVLREYEFSGNWWRAVWFAVHDPKNTGTYNIFDRVLSGQGV
ncbi:hypothetical protein NM208_g4426 [Fusarium decemcellulare]|uniref:Uncharacterized protein n=1 Tax=Fusarium decemcellulare TaxID=57161 RepID=A0ACC1SKW6_9HYPO|nr:hypothetical protein NM208_g4426 [Fusarium decemcellulare]